MVASKQQLTELRDRIAEIDRRLVEQLEERFEISKKIHSLQEGEPAIVDGSDRELLEAIEKHARGVAPKESLRGIFSKIAAEARGVERASRVAYVGPEGNFCHQMVQTYFGAATTFIECPTVVEVLEQVRRERASFAAFAFDSSVDGLILPAISALAETDLVLVAERTVPAAPCLMSKSGAADGVQKIYGTAAGHASCELTIEREFPSATVIDVRSPGEAAEIAASDPASAAIAPEATGRNKGLSIIKENIGDEPELKYRYGIAGTRPAIRTGNDTTCLLFSLDDAPGTLHQVLSHFAERGLNLKKIQSRPVRAATWDYIFYVEVGGHATDRAVVTALEAMKRSTRYLKLLGSFPTEA